MTNLARTKRANEVTTPTEPKWVHTLGNHDIGSVIGWRGEDSPTGWWSGIVREVGSTCVKVDSILPGVMS